MEQSVELKFDCGHVYDSSKDKIGPKFVKSCFVCFKQAKDIENQLKDLASNIPAIFGGTEKQNSYFTYLRRTFIDDVEHLVYQSENELAIELYTVMINSPDYRTWQTLINYRTNLKSWFRDFHLMVQAQTEEDYKKVRKVKIPYVFRDYISNVLKHKGYAKYLRGEIEIAASMESYFARKNEPMEINA